MLRGVMIENTFLALGFFLVVLGFLVDKELALRTVFLTLIFGGIFRVIKIIANRLLVHGKIQTKKDVVLRMVKLGIWLISIIAYAYFLNKIIHIF